LAGKGQRRAGEKTGAHHYIDSGGGDAAAELQKLGGANVILATAPNAQAISALVDGLSAGGKLVMPAAPAESLAISPTLLFRKGVPCWAGIRHSERFAGHIGIQCVGLACTR
jgi:D-arabinose 1-dehydrogenase-like Zn-dependent alcohol dehydrogenase